MGSRSIAGRAPWCCGRWRRAGGNKYPPPTSVARGGEGLGVGNCLAPPTRRRFIRTKPENLIIPRHRAGQPVVIFLRITERATVRFILDRAGHAGIAVAVAVTLRGEAAAGTRRRNLARYRARLADAPAARAAHQIDVDVIVVIDDGAG